MTVVICRNNIETFAEKAIFFMEGDVSPDNKDIKLLSNSSLSEKFVL